MGNLQESYNTPRYRTPQVIPQADYERNPSLALWERFGGVFQFGVLKRPLRILT